MQTSLQAEVHEHNGTATDADGEPMIGFYFQFFNSDGSERGLPMGPYGSYDAAAKACQADYDNHED